MKFTVLILILFMFSSIYGQRDGETLNLLKDILHNDDVIITGNECVGSDCVDGENFMSDSQKFKENSIRIHFEDTSVTPGFPSNDWRFIVNDNYNGGEDFFALQDVTSGNTAFRINAGTPHNTFYINSSGNLGLGTDIPVVEIHSKEGDTPTLRLEQDATSGWTPQTWDVAGNDANFFIRDVTNASSLPFRIKPGAPDNSLFIDPSGNIGLGTDLPTAKLHVNGDIGKTGSIIGVSDARLKNIQSPILNASSILMMLEGRVFEYKSQEFESLNLPTGKQYGLVAQEVEKVIPELVVEEFIYHSENGKIEKLKGVKYEQLIPILINSLKEQQNQIQTLEQENEAMLKRLEKIEKLLTGEE